MAAVAAEAHGIDAAAALAAMASVGEVAGRFTTRSVGGVPARLMLAKNPAGWSELFGVGACGHWTGGGEHQREDRRRWGPELAVGRALRTPVRPGGGGHG